MKVKPATFETDKNQNRSPKRQINTIYESLKTKLSRSSPSAASSQARNSETCSNSLKEPNQQTELPKAVTSGQRQNIDEKHGENALLGNCVDRSAEQEGGAGGRSRCRSLVLSSPATARLLSQLVDGSPPPPRPRSLVFLPHQPQTRYV